MFRQACLSSYQTYRLTRMSVRTVERLVILPTPVIEVVEDSEGDPAVTALLGEQLFLVGHLRHVEFPSFSAEPVGFTPTSDAVPNRSHHPRLSPRV